MTDPYDTRLKDFVEKYKKEIVVKLIPGLRVAGYTEPLVVSPLKSSTLHDPDSVISCEQRS
jgi:hypothetical protein